MFWDLVREIKARLEADLVEIGLRAPTAEPSYRTPVVKVVATIPKVPAKDETPGALIAPVAWNRKDNMETGVVSLVLQTYGFEKTDQAPGLNELGSLAAAVRRSLARPSMLASRFELTGEMRLFNDLSVVHPFYRAELVTEWQWPAVIERLDMDDQQTAYGAGYPAGF